MPKSSQIIITGQIRLRLDPILHDGQQLDARELAEAARQFLRDELGLSRVHLQAPRAGRGEERGSQVVTPHFIYGTFDFPYEPPKTKKAAPAARQPRVATAPAATGPTKRLRKPAAMGRTKRLKKKPKARNVITPDDIGSTGVFLCYDAVAQRYYAHGVIGPLAGCYSDPVRLKSEAAAIARKWIDLYGRTGRRPEQWPGAWRPAPQPRAATGKTTKLARKKP